MSNVLRKLSFMSAFKNPFLVVAFLLVLIFFIPVPEIYNSVKLIIAFLVVAYGMGLGAFGKKNKTAETVIKKEEIEKVIDDINND